MGLCVSFGALPRTVEARCSANMSYKLKNAPGAPVNDNTIYPLIAAASTNRIIPSGPGAAYGKCCVDRPGLGKFCADLILDGFPPYNPALITGFDNPTALYRGAGHRAKSIK